MKLVRNMVEEISIDQKAVKKFDTLTPFHILDPELCNRANNKLPITTTK